MDLGRQLQLVALLPVFIYFSYLTDLEISWPQASSRYLPAANIARATLRSGVVPLGEIRIAAVTFTTTS